MANDDLGRMTLAETAAAIRAKTLSSVEAVAASLARIDRQQGRINCFIAVEHDAALAAARRADERPGRGPLHGVPIAVKDMFDREGKTATGGARLFENRLAPSTSPVIRRLEAAGAVLVGTLNLDELAAGGTGDNLHFGRCRNPWNQASITGGSSSGSAAAVAARLVPGTLGSDTGGSIRLPAAFCGVTALKTSYGRVSRLGVMPRSWSNDSVGPVARTAHDCALLLQAIAGGDRGDATLADAPVPDYAAALGGDLRGIKLGFALRQFGVDGHPLSTLFAEVERTCRALGALTREVELGDIELLTSLHQVLVKSEGASVCGRDIRERPEAISLAARSVIEAGFLIPATRYAEALGLRGPLLRHFVAAHLDDCDAILAPIYLGAAPAHAALQGGTTAGIAAFFAASARTLRFVNYLGLPSLALPCGFDAAGMPIGVQVIGRPFSEALLLRIGHAYQSATDWHQRMTRLDGEGQP